MELIEIAKNELIKTGMSNANADKFAREMFIGFSLKVIDKYAQQKFKEGAIAQRKLCSETKLLTKYSKFGLELAQAIQHQVLNAPEPSLK